MSDVPSTGQTLPVPPVQRPVRRRHYRDVDVDLFDAAARLVHAEHDRFSWEMCGEETCRALRECEVTG